MDRSQPPVDADYVVSVRADSRRLIELDTNYGGDDLARVAAHAFRTAFDRLASGVYVATVERDLQAAVGELAQVGAWIAYDADKQALSRQLANEALAASRAAGDRRMEWFELGQLAMQSVHLGRAGEALRVADEVLTAGPSSPRVAAVFRLRRARALALTGDRARTLDEHNRLVALLAEGVTNRDPDWTWWVDPAELAWQRAMSLTSLGDRSDAVDHFRLAWELRPVDARRARFNDLAHLLESQVDVGAWSDAESTLATIVASVEDVRSARTTNLLRGTVRQIDRQRDAVSSTVNDLTDELARALSDSDW
jgi:tetratricopeptide (TPR) repeat protein